MKHVLMMGPVGPRLYLQAVATHITCGIADLNDDGPHARFASISIGYDMRELLPISAMIGEMERRKMLPFVYVWHEDKPEVEVAVIFGLEKPSKHLTSEILRGAEKVLLPPPGKLDYVFTTGEAGTSSPEMPMFLQTIEREGFVAVCVYDSTDIENSESECTPLQTFMVPHILHEKPDFMHFLMG